MTALLTSDHGVEMSPVASARSRGVALQRALLRSYDQGTTVSRTTRVRHLRNGQMLDGSLIVFEVSELPILHYPDPADPKKVTSSLEVFLFDEAPGSPEVPTSTVGLKARITASRPRGWSLPRP